MLLNAENKTIRDEVYHEEVIDRMECIREILKILLDSAGLKNFSIYRFNPNVNLG